MFIFRFHSKPNELPNRVTVVGRVVNENLEIAVSRCSSKDNFSRKKGNFIAEKRLEEGKLFCNFPMKDCTVKQFVLIAKGVSSEVSNNPHSLKNN